MSRTTNETSTVRANREVILAAGAVRTPQTLQLSGVGPEALLSSLGIETVVDLPVGSNFQDQPTLYMQFTCGSCISYGCIEEVLMMKQMATIPSRPQTGSSRMRVGLQISWISTTETAQVSTCVLLTLHITDHKPQAQ